MTPSEQEKKSYVGFIKNLIQDNPAYEGVDPLFLHGHYNRVLIILPPEIIIISTFRLLYFLRFVDNMFQVTSDKETQDKIDRDKLRFVDNDIFLDNTNVPRWTGGMKLGTAVAFFT